MALGEIVVSLLAKTGSFDTDIARSTKATEKRMKEMQRTVEEAGAAMGVALTAGAAATVFMTKKWIDQLDALNDAADATGASIENLSALEDVALRTGTSMDSATGALVKFNAGLKGTDDDGKAAKALEAIGLNIDRLRQMDPAEALLETAKALARFADDGDKARLVQELFGKSVREMAPLLKDLADKGELVATVTTEQAKQAEAFNKELFTMHKNVTDLGRAFASDLVTGINNAAAAYRENGSVWAGIKMLFGGTEQFKADKKFADLTDDLLSAQKKLQDAQRLAASGQGGLFAAGWIRDAEREVKRLQAEIAPLMAARQAANAPMSLDDLRRGELAFKPGVGAVDTRRTPKPPRGATIKEPKPFATDDRFTEADAIARETQMLNEAQEAWRKWEDKATEASQKVTDAYDEHLQQLLNQGPEARLEAQRQEMQLLADAFEKGTINAQQFNDAATGYLHLTAEKVTETKSMTEELGLTFASAFENAVIGGRGLSGVFQGLLQDIARVILRMGAIEPLMKHLKDTMQGGGGGFNLGSLFSSFGSAFSMGAGDALGMSIGGTYGPQTQAGLDNLINSLPGRAAGGPVAANSPYMIGERGPELFVPRTAGMIVPMSKAGSEGGHTTIVNQTTGRVDNVVEQRISPRERVLFLQEARAAIAADIHNANSPVSEAMRRNYGLQRTRS